eukprot:scaffold12.g8248.t1
MGIKEYEPRVVQQLTDFAFRYTSDVLQEAQAGAGCWAARNAAAAPHSGRGWARARQQAAGSADRRAIAERAGSPRGQVGLADLLLATQARAPHAFAPPPPQRALRGLAARANARPLPPLRERAFGVRLPPEADCLTAANWQVREGARAGGVGAGGRAEGARVVDGRRQQQAAAAAAAAAQQQQWAAQRPRPDGGGGGARREARIGMALPGEGWQPPAGDAVPPEPIAAPGAAGTGAVLVDGAAQQQQQQEQQAAGAAEMEEI